jgi:putative DNA primase/helicase
MVDDATFRPLSESERSAAAVDNAPKEEASGELVVPIPAGAPNPLSEHPKWGKPTASWTYRNSKGEPLAYVQRFDPPGEGKQFLPLTVWRSRNGLRWRRKVLPSPRPLYGLDRLAAKPDATAIICEGEKAADAAARIFPSCVALASWGGSEAAAMTDWTPLAGRRAIIFPDNDQAGADYGSMVSTILTALKCEISVIDTAALAAIDGAGRGHDWSPDGWDAADAIAEWPSIEALRAEAFRLAMPSDLGPTYVSHGQFHMRSYGLWCEAPHRSKKGDDDQRERLEMWLSGPFEILGRVRDNQGGEWARLLRWNDEDGREHVETVRDADLHGEASALAAQLAHGGLKIATGRGSREKLVAYLNGADVRARITSVDRTGWHVVADRSIFVLPSGPIGAPSGETVLLQGGATAAYSVKGTLETWRETVGQKIAGHSRAVLAVSVAFAGPLLHLTGQDGFGVHLYGSSSTGKTTLLQAAGSVWGPPSLVRPWRATANALEASAALATDALLCLDEIGAVDARDAGPAIYALFNGEGKGRARIDGNLRKSKSWRIAALSSGEIPIAAKMVEGGKRATAGQSVRMLDIQADAGRGFGCFDQRRRSWRRRTDCECDQVGGEG